MSDKGRAFINIENVVASATLKQKIDLNAIVRVFPGVEYRPEYSAQERWSAPAQNLNARPIRRS